MIAFTIAVYSLFVLFLAGVIVYTVYTDFHGVYTRTSHIIFTIDMALAAATAIMAFVAFFIARV